MNKYSDMLSEGITRRQALSLGGLSVLVLASGSVSKSCAEDKLIARQADLALFMTVSRFAAGHSSLDDALGEALFSAFQEKDPLFLHGLCQLQDRIRETGSHDVEHLQDALQSKDENRFLLKIVRAWYAGIIEDGTNAHVYSYEKALMYKPTQDVVVLPTYAHNGPNYWIAEPNPVEAMPTF